ncbi:MAG TPA: glycogen/starch/alpha-glucan phosphorylase, partial [Tepidisphaeraceae bacterium]|nr:glycogen/starch/alpha-glucan phosphorylase [Tepidisphaeraceae bacterium]
AMPEHMLEHTESAPMVFFGAEDASFDRHLVFDHAIDPRAASDRQRFEALASSIRDLLTDRWLKTRQCYEAENPKQVCYLSMEFLLGRSLNNNIANLLAEPLVHDAMKREGLDLAALAEQEPDAGLGNGGLGRLAACYMDSLATMQIPAVGYGLRYEYGMFRQGIKNGWQTECPDNWLKARDPWEVRRPEQAVEARIDCSLKFEEGIAQLADHHGVTVQGIPYDRPMVGYGGKTVNTLRLWGASTPDYFDLNEFNHGDFFGAVHEKVLAENVTRVLYPDDSTSAGRHLRFLQEYFLVACSLADILRNFRKSNRDWRSLPDKVAIQLNDTHPSMAVAELMRILLDQAHLGWDQAWDLTTRTLAYTNHTLLPEALEKWPVELFEMALPRQLEIIYEINRRFLNDVNARFGGDVNRVRRMSLIEEGAVKQVRMANLAIVGTHSTNGVAAIHSELLRKRTVRDFADMFPQRFNNKTNGVTPRRWLLLANPPLAELITGAIGDGWITELSQLRRLAPLAEDKGFRSRFCAAKRAAKVKFADWLKSSGGPEVDPDSIFDCQIKRIHEYKRQLLNVLRIIILFNRLRQNPQLSTPNRTFFFAGKAAPAYQLAKLIIKLINNVAEVIDNDPISTGRLKVHFLAEYNVSLAERLIPATDVSEQISTAGYEASGTSNMKFMMNGALTVGTRDGATIEMAQEAGEENFFMFGLTAEQVAGSRGWYNPQWHYDNDPETRQALDMISRNYFSPHEPGIFNPILDTLLAHGDFYMHLADLTSYVATQTKVSSLYLDRDGWARKAILNVAASGKFSSDRAIGEYAAEIWHARPCPPPD